MQMTPGYIKRLSIREMQIKTTMSYHHTSVRMVMIRKAGRTWRKGKLCAMLVEM